ncbi:MAG: TRAP transporter large permease subunit [Candidatus Methylomirabilota bacterium]|jgi:TRAP-type C4-dicarboxylate transport system permease large subunit
MGQLCRRLLILGATLGWVLGLAVVYNLVIGLLTPPVGLVLFVTSKIAEISSSFPCSPRCS